MSAIETLSNQPAAQAIAWALLQFVWQGAVIGAITWAALVALRRSAADVRYVVGTIGLSLMLTMPVVTAVQMWRASSSAPVVEYRASNVDIAPVPRVERITGETPVVTAVDNSESATFQTPKPTQGDWLFVFLLGWLCGVSALSLRLLSGWVWVCRMKSHGTAPAAFPLQETASRLARALHVPRAVRFLESSLVEVPTVIGWLRPVILIPASAIAALSPQQLEAIIAHELAHIRRHDYLVNLLQTLVETLLFYHPAVWWLSRRIRIERENCCDDLAVSLCGDRVIYARALADLEQLRGGGLALAANGGSLLSRVRRLLGAPTHAGRGPGWLAGLVAVVVMAGVAAGAIGNSAGSNPQTAATPVAGPQPATAPAVEAATTTVAATAATPAIASTRGSQAVELKTAHPSTATAVAVTVGPQAITVTAFEPAIAALEGATVLMTQPLIASLRASEEALAVSIESLRTIQESTHTESRQSSSGGKHRGTFVWSNDKEKIEVDYSGELEFTDDDTDVKSITPGGWLKIRDGGPRGHAVEFRADQSGQIQRRYWVGASEQPFEPEGRKWLAGALPRFIRQTGLGAPGRVARILRSGGVDGVLAEISLIEGSWAKRVYYSELLKTGKADPPAIERILTQAGRDLDSDFELASLLIDHADRLLVSEATRRAYFAAARSIDSDFEMRRVYSSALKRGPVASDLLASLLDAASTIESDFEAASLLAQVASLQPLDARTRPAFFKVAGTVESDFEHRRVLNALASRSDADADTLKAVLESGAQIDSDFESAELLMTVLRRGPVEAQYQDAFFRAVESLDSSFERSRVLQTLARRRDASAQNVVAVLRAARPIDSDFERAQVLLALAATHTIKGEARDLYIDIAERLGDFEQGRTLSALVKNERNAK